jgi:hypothetical protein
MRFLSETLKRASFMVAGIALGVFLSEAFLRIAKAFKEPVPKAISNYNVVKSVLRTDPILGQVIRENRVSDHQLIFEGKVAISARYTTDEYGRRSSPQNSGEKKYFAIFTGSSNVFSWGVNDEDAWPNILGERLGNFNIYNYGIKGGGPQILPLLTQRMIQRKEISEKKGVYFYVFIDDHLGRLVGSFRHSWGMHLLNYRLDESLTPIKLGTFANSRPILNTFYGWLSALEIANLLNFNVPFGVREKDLLLLSKLLKVSYLEFMRAYPESLFYVLLLEGEHTNRVRAYLDKENIPSIVFNYPDVNEGNFIPGDGHLSKKGCKLLAEILLREISKDPALAEILKRK